MIIVILNPQHFVIKILIMIIPASGFRSRGTWAANETWSVMSHCHFNLKGENFTLNIHTLYTGQIIKGETVLCTLCHQTEIGLIDLC